MGRRAGKRGFLCAVDSAWLGKFTKGKNHACVLDPSSTSPRPSPKKSSSTGNRKHSPGCPASALEQTPSCSSALMILAVGRSWSEKMLSREIRCGQMWKPSADATAAPARQACYLWTFSMPGPSPGQAQII